MSCLECESPFCSMPLCSGCEQVSCKALFLHCNNCKKMQCMECIEECECCEASLCTSCAIQDVQISCKCCKRVMDSNSQPVLCVSCVVIHWLANDKNMGYLCDTCVEHCSEDECNVNKILDQQNECPICLEPFGYDYSLQHCDLHKVCVSCNYDKNRGCPICRVGKARRTI
jgi:hypothetical protein